RALAQLLVAGVFGRGLDDVGGVVLRHLGPRQPAGRRHVDGVAVAGIGRPRLGQYRCDAGVAKCLLEPGTDLVRLGAATLRPFYDFTTGMDARRRHRLRALAVVADAQAADLLAVAALNLDDRAVIAVVQLRAAIEPMRARLGLAAEDGARRRHESRRQRHRRR